MNPLEFGVKNLWSIPIGGTDIWITDTVVNTWIIMLFLIGFAVITRILLRRFQEIPKGFQNFIEMTVEALDGIVLSSAGADFAGLGHWFYMVFIFILVSNLSGMVGMRPPTADFATVFAFAFSTFFLIQALGIARRKGEYLKGFLDPFPVFLPLNIIGELARPISLSFRLFGNVLAGMILMTLVYALLPIYLKFVLPAALHAYFDLFSGVLQTYIFCVLSITYIGAAASEEA